MTVRGRVGSTAPVRRREATGRRLPFLLLARALAGPRVVSEGPPLGAPVSAGRASLLDGPTPEAQVRASRPLPFVSSHTRLNGGVAPRVGPLGRLSLTAPRVAARPRAEPSTTRRTKISPLESGLYQGRRGDDGTGRGGQDRGATTAGPSPFRTAKIKRTRSGLVLFSRVSSGRRVFVLVSRRKEDESKRQGQNGTRVTSTIPLGPVAQAQVHIRGA